MTPSDFEQRSAEERERARLEREAKRAAKRGEAPPPMPPPTEGLEPSVPDPQVPGPPEPEPGGFEPPGVEPAPAAPRRSPRDRAADRAAAARVALRHRRKREEAPPRPPRDPGSGFGGGSGSGRSPWKTGAIVVAILIALVGAWFLWSVFQPFKGDGDGDVRVSIPTGASVTQIGEILEENGVIDSEFFFRTRVTLDGSRGDLKPGSYKLKEGMSYGDVIDTLSEGPPRDVAMVVVPEGRSREEIAPTVKSAGLTGNYLEASQSSDDINLRRYKAAGADSLEGFLFPATYELKRGSSANQLVSKQLEAFEREFAGVDLSYAKKKNLTPYDILIIASMVEREAGVAKDRPLIASVIYNRLKNGIPLGIDATIRYENGNWEEPLKQSELAADTPYNTRINAGLPPGPIGNPGIDSIKAAANPAKTDYLFFVVKPCGEGEHAFSETDAEFQQDVERYHAEREAQGGKSPTDC
jgi:uncharacterized YceG family protein